MLTPLHDNVVLQKVKQENKTKSGILLTTAAPEENCAVVTAIGPDVEESLLVVGKKVLYKEFKGITATVDGEDYIVIPDKEIVAVIE